MEDQCLFATVYDQELAFYSFRQENLSNPQWYERFNTKVDVGDAIGVTRQHKALLEHVAQERTPPATFDSLTDADQATVREDAEERYLSYAFLRQSGVQHGNLKVDLQNDFTTGDNRYPKTRQQTLHLLDKYSKITVPKATLSEGASFAQGGGKGNNKEPFDKEYWKDKECYNCHKKGHPASQCPDKDADDKSIASQAKSVKKLAKDMKSMKKAFTQLQQLQEASSDLSDSDSTEQEASHFQTGEVGFQFTQVDRAFEPRITKLFKQAHGPKLELDLREIILLDSQSMMDLFCN